MWNHAPQNGTWQKAHSHWNLNCIWEGRQYSILRILPKVLRKTAYISYGFWSLGALLPSCRFKWMHCQQANWNRVSDGCLLWVKGGKEFGRKIECVICEQNEMFAFLDKDLLNHNMPFWLRIFRNCRKFVFRERIYCWNKCYNDYCCTFFSFFNCYGSSQLL